MAIQILLFPWSVTWLRSQNGSSSFGGRDSVPIIQFALTAPCHHSSFGWEKDEMSKGHIATF
jgi:hypothetical protein